MKLRINVFDHGRKAYDPKPVRHYSNDAGADVRTVEGITLKPHETKLVPLGFGLELPDGLMACIFPRSSKSCEGLVCEMAPIDAGYTGEVCAIVTNMTDRIQKVPGGTAIGQLVVLPVLLVDFVEDFGDVRGDNAFGSTDKL